MIANIVQNFSLIFLTWNTSSVYFTRQIFHFWGTRWQCVPTYVNRIAKHILLWVGRTLLFATILGAG